MPARERTTPRHAAHLAARTRHAICPHGLHEKAVDGRVGHRGRGAGDVKRPAVVLGVHTKSPSRRAVG